jgi:alpha-galactosidase
MPQLNLTVNEFHGIMTPMPTSILKPDSLPEPSSSRIINAASLTLNLSQPPKKFFRHGWHSWSLTTWLDPSEPQLPIRAPEFRAKDEDPAYALHKNHISAWVGAVELGEDDILLLGALGLGGRVELDGQTIHGFYESVEQDGTSYPQSVPPYEWLLARGKEDEVFAKYTSLLEKKFGKTRFESPPRVWCSWYSFLIWINENILLNTLRGLSHLPFDVFQIDDGWQDESGHWEAGRKFPSGMAAFADKVKATGRKAGIWLAPFITSPKEKLFHERPDWLLRDESGNLVGTGLHWTYNTHALDLTHPEVLTWLDALIRKVVGWGYDYLKLDFLHAGAAVGKRYKDLPREEAYRNAMQVIRDAAGDAYILACGAPILPSLGLCDGIRVGPDVAPFWFNKALTVWLNNPNDICTQNAIRTGIHRLWLKPLVNVDPDVMFFRSRYNWLKPHENQLLQDLGAIARFKATSDLPQWWTASEREKVREFLEADPQVQKKTRYKYQIDGRDVDFSPAIPIPVAKINIPVWLAKNWGLLKIVRHQILPALLASMGTKI